jgi:hypothetical protein
VEQILAQPTVSAVALARFPFFLPCISIMMQPVSIQIPQPCAESWDAMTPTGAGRHCAACQKTVVDFTLKSDAEILAYLAGATGETCGRLSLAQQNRPLQPTLAEHGRPASRWRAWVALALAAWGLRATSAAATGTPASGPRTATHPHKKASPRPRLTPPTPKLLHGTVLDAATHEPLADVAVFLKGENRSATTDSAGHFSLPLPAQRPRAGRALVLHYAGYQSMTVPVPASPAPALQLALQADPAAAGATIVGYSVQHRQDITGGVVVVTKAEVQPLEELRARRARSFWQRITQPFRQYSKP